MGVKTKKTPYQGLWVFVPMMMLPSIAITWLLYVVIAKQQSQFSQELNMASAKIFGFGSGILFHFSCWLCGAFKEDFQAVKIRVRELFENLTVSWKLALSCYWDDVKTLGMAFWIDMALIALNIGVFVDALLDFMAMLELL